MEKTIVMPKMGMTMEVGTIYQIFVKPGDMVNEDDPILEFETNKMTESITAPCAGQIVEILCKEDDEIPVGQPVCTMIC